MERATPEIVRFRRLNRWRNSGLRYLPGFESAFKKAFQRVRQELREPVDIRLDGFTVLAAPGDPVVSERLILRRRYEKRQTRLVRKVLTRRAVFCDVGANIGYYSLLAASIVGPEGRVISFEPDPAHAELIEKAAEWNQFRQIEVHSLALAAKRGSATLHRNTENAGNQSLLAANTSVAAEAIEVQVSTLDQVIAETLDNRPVDLLKVDTEGAEALVLAGASQTLETPGLQILLEFWPEGIRRFGSDPALLLQDLVDRGFLISSLERDGSTPSVTVDQALHLPAGQDQIDLYLRRTSA